MLLSMTKHRYTFIVPSLATAMPTDLFPIALFFWGGGGGIVALQCCIVSTV